MSLPGRQVTVTQEHSGPEIFSPAVPWARGCLPSLNTTSPGNLSGGLTSWRRPRGARADATLVCAAICPHRPSRLLSAVWHDRGSQHWSARLGMSENLDDPFVSPDLRLLQTKICTTDSGVMTTELQGRDLRRHHAGPEHESLENPRPHSLGMIQHDILISEQHEKLVLMRHGDPFRKTGRIP